MTKEQIAAAIIKREEYESNEDMQKIERLGELLHSSRLTGAETEFIEGMLTDGFAHWSYGEDAFEIQEAEEKYNEQQFRARQIIQLHA